MASDLEAPALLEHLHAMGRFDLSSMLTYERLRMATTIANLAREVERMRDALVRIRDQEEPQHPTGTWAADIARGALDPIKEAADGQ